MNMNGIVSYTPKSEEEKMNTLFHTVFVHILPIVMSKKRIKGFTMEFPGWGKIKKMKVAAVESPNVFDYLTYVSIYKYILDNREKLKRREIIEDEKIIDVEYSIEIPVYTFLRRYRMLDPKSKTNKRLIWDSIVRMASCKWEIEIEGGTIKLLNVIQDAEQKIREGKILWKIVLNRKIVDSLLEGDRKMWMWLDLYPVYRCRTNAAKALCIWAQGQRQTVWRVDTLISVLHLSSSRKENIRTLTKAFRELRDVGFLVYFKKYNRGPGEMYFAYEKVPHYLSVTDGVSQELCDFVMGYK